MAMDTLVETLPEGLVAVATQATPAVELAQASASPSAGEAEVATVKTVTCRRCLASVPEEDTLVTQKFREDLRYTCRSCHAVQTQLQRHGIDLKTVLSEEDVASFFLDAKAERDNTADKRLSYAQARGILKKKMVESDTKVDRLTEKEKKQNTNLCPFGN